MQVEWGLADALPSDLVVAKSIGTTRVDTISVARGNMVLADHGQTFGPESLDPPRVPTHGLYRPRLQQPDLTYRVPYDHAQAIEQPAATAILQDPHLALPVITLSVDGPPWQARHDLLNSGREDRVFVVEMENDRRATLRFGDGILGKKPTPDTSFRARYRVGNGVAGNVGREAIQSVALSTEKGLTEIVGVRNLLPAQGGTDPETLAHVQHNAPYAFETQKRCVIDADYNTVAELHPEVQQARASRRWTGSWNTVFLAVDRKHNRPVDDAFRQTLSAFMQPYLLADADLEIRPPQFVSLEIALTVHLAPEHFPSTVKQNLLEAFSNVDLPTGQRGFFHPDNMRFGQPVYLSQIVAWASQIAGVLRVEVERFQRWRQPDQGERSQDLIPVGLLPIAPLEQGFIPIGPLQIAPLDNNPNAPEYGEISFTVRTE